MLYPRERIKKTNLEKYGSENPFGSSKIIAKIRETNKEKYGFEHPMQNYVISSKTKQTNRAKYRVEVSSKAECVKEKAKETNLRIYGKEHHCSDPSVLEKTFKTNEARYGTKWSFESAIVKEKIKNSLFRKHGVDHSSKIKGIQTKKKLIYFKKYGVYHHFSNKDIIKKRELTNIQRYGVAIPTQSAIIQAKIQKSGLRFKTYVTPIGEIRKVQGYEPRALDILFKDHPESDVITDCSKIPRISYTSNSKSCYYFPDIYIPSQKKIVEVKSTWTYRLHFKTNCLKWKATKDAGYNCEFWIFDKNHLEIIDDPINCGN